jgi:hypothetical protein
VTDATVISCLYGDSHDEYVDEWVRALRGLDPAPAWVIVGTDRPRLIGGVLEVEADAGGRYPQPAYLNAALELVRTEWVWQLDVDDVAFSDALEGLELVAGDVWQLGYTSSDGEDYRPPQLAGAELLELDRNPFVAGSCIRASTLRAVGGFPDVALQDWALWRELARAGASFVSSSRSHFYYRRHAMTRGQTELTISARAEHLEEMLARETRVPV